jgi:hypothetical protein
MCQDIQIYNSTGENHRHKEEFGCMGNEGEVLYFTSRRASNVI